MEAEPEEEDRTSRSKGELPLNGSVNPRMIGAWNDLRKEVRKRDPC